MTDDALRGLLIFGVIFCAAMGVFLVWLCVRVAKKADLAPPVEVPKPPRYLPTIQTFYADTEYNYVAIADPPGHLVLAWREWAGDGYKDRALDVLLVRENGVVDTLGTCVDFEVYGPPEQQIQRSSS